ncbi:MAG: hypothetical protein ACE5KM_10160 [Planctomycetaceae bacterium]
MPAVATDTPLSQLTEHIRDWRSADVVVDREQRAVRNIALTGLESVNGYRYSERALREALPLYEGKPVFLDHARNLARPFERSTRDLVGTVVNPRFADGRVRGDIQALDTEAGRTFIALSESRSSAVGMSHVVLARRNAANTIVETIEEVVSVDAVVFPATSSTFGEQRDAVVAEPLPGSLESLLEQFNAELPPHVAALLNAETVAVRRIGLFPGTVIVEVDGARSPASERTQRFALDWSWTDGSLVLGESLNSLAPTAPVDLRWEASFETGFLRERLREAETERDELRRRLAGYETRDAQAERYRRTEALIREARLPEFAVTEEWKRQLVDAGDESAQRVLIAERKTLLCRLRLRTPDSRERVGVDDGPCSDTQFVAAIRGSRAAACG